MAKSKDTDVLSTFASAGNDAIGLINRVDDATGKIQPGKRKGSIIKSAQQNVFEFPVFISNSIPIDYAEAVSSLLEQVYASYLQMAISINPVVDADSVKRGLQFANYKTNTNKYLECVDSEFQKDACHSVYQEGSHTFEFNLVSIEDRDARVINEAVEYEPLSEFNHFFQEAKHLDSYYQERIPFPEINTLGQVPRLRNISTVNNDPRYALQRDADGNIRYGTTDEVMAYLNEKGVANEPTQNGDEPPYDAFIRFVRHYHLGAPAESEMDRVDRQLNDPKTDTTSTYGDISYTQHMANQRQSTQYKRDVDKWNSHKATSPYYKTADSIKTGADTVGSVANAVRGTSDAIYSVGTLGQRIKAEKLKNEKLKDEVENLAGDRAAKRSEVNAKLAAKAPQYVDDSKCQKLNTMKPLMMQVTVNMLNKDDSLQPINYIIGVKTRNRVIPANILPEVARYPLKEMDKISRKVKWKAGELKFLKDLVFRIKEKKQTAADSRDPNRKWYRRLYELAHMKGDAPAAAVVQGKSLFATFIRDKQGKGSLQNGMIPNCSMVISQSDVINIKNQTEINLLKGSTAKAFCGELFLISLVVIDTDTESIKLMLPDMNNDYDVHSLGAVNKQLAMLDTAGQKTRDMFKLLG